MNEQRQTDIKNAGLRSRSVMAWLRDHLLPAEPVCYTIAYEYLFSDNQQLKQSVDALDFGSEDSKKMFEQVYRESIIAQHYTDKIQGKNVDGYVDELLNLLSDSTKEIDGINNKVGEIKNNLDQDNAQQALAEQAALLEQCSGSIKNKLEDSAVQLKALQEEYLDIKEQATKDELTEVLDQKGLMATLNSAIKYEENYPVSVIRFDVDKFKQFNDTNGTKMGNAVLKHIAKAFVSQLETNDIVSRFEEDEFLLVLPKTPLANAMSVADILRKKIEAISLKKKGALAPVKVTISGGVAEFNGQGKFDTTMDSAKKALGRSKDLGRNCVNQES